MADQPLEEEKQVVTLCYSQGGEYLRPLTHGDRVAIKPHMPVEYRFYLPSGWKKRLDVAGVEYYIIPYVSLHFR